MIFVDSNVPMYLVGGDHPHKSDAIQILSQLAIQQQALVTSAEVLQEILHRYLATQRPDRIQPAFDALLDLVAEVLPIEREDVLDAKAMALARHGVPARDCLHIAVMQRHEISTILSFDRHFDRVPGIVRLAAGR